MADMEKLLRKWIERLQKRIDNSKDDPRDWERVKREFDKIIDEQRKKSEYEK